jgi:hypothetical protein
LFKLLTLRIVTFNVHGSPLNIGTNMMVAISLLTALITYQYSMT